MQKNRHFDILKSGAAKWNVWRENNADIEIDLSNLVLNDLDLIGANLSNICFHGTKFFNVNLKQASMMDCDLRHTHFDGSDLYETNLNGSRLHHANLCGANLALSILDFTNMTNANLSKAIVRNASARDAIFVDTNLMEADLSFVDFFNSDLRGANLRHALIHNTSFVGGNLSYQILSCRNFEEINFYNATMCGVVLNDCRFCRSNFEMAQLNDANLKHAAFSGSNLRGALLVRSDMSGASFNGCDMFGVDMSESNAEGCDFRASRMSLVRFNSTNLHKAGLMGTDLRSAQFDSRTNLMASHVYNCKISRYSLESLTNYGGLTVGQRMDMDIEDGVAVLRSYYSGFWQTVHILALIVFVLPYIFFVLKQYTFAKLNFHISGETTTLLLSLMKYVYTGGTNQSISWVAFPVFLWSLCYNFLRLILLYKTKALELKQQISGLPVAFSLDSGWGTLLKVANTMFYINVLLVVAHTLHFMQTKVSN